MGSFFCEMVLCMDILVDILFVFFGNCIGVRKFDVGFLYL